MIYYAETPDSFKYSDFFYIHISFDKICKAGKKMSLEFYEIRFEDRKGRMVRREIEGDGEYWAPKLNLAMGNEHFTSFDEIPNFYEIAPYLKEFLILSPILEVIDLGIFKNLRKLNLHISAPEIKGLGKIKDLEWLDLSYTHFKKIEWLNRLKKIHNLNLKKVDISKIPEMGGLRKLKKFDLSHNKISKIEGLNGLEKLEILELSHNQIAKMEGFDGLKNLKHLNLSDNKISKIEGLNGLENLNFLYLSNNPISKIEGLEGLEKLNSISLSNSKIKSIAGIDCLQDIYSIDITNTNVSSLEPLKKFKKIGYIRARNCPIRSLHGINTDPNRVNEILIDSKNLSTTGANLLRKAVSRINSYRYREQDFPPLVEFYRRSTTELALQHINQFNLDSMPLTPQETERLIHEATQKERMILEDAVSKKILAPNDSILYQINNRFSISIKGRRDMKILL